MNLSLPFLIISTPFHAAASGGFLISRDLFAQYVKDALLAFHDSVRLQLSPLVELLRLRQAPGETATATLRQLLRDALESLRPTEGVPLGRPEWIGYRLLLLRYVRSYSVQATCRELGFSLASFYRYHQEALEALVSLLWDKYRQQAAADMRESLRAQSPPEEQAREEAVKLARESHRQSVDLGSVLEAAAQIVLPLASQRGLTLRIERPPSLPMTYGDPAMLRQIMLNVLTETIKFAVGDALELAVNVREGDILCCLRGFDSSQTVEELEQASGIAVSRGLLEVYGGRLWFEKQLESGQVLIHNNYGEKQNLSSGQVQIHNNHEENQNLSTGWALCFTIPGSKPKTVLVIDDDADTVRLYQRLLQAHDYIVRTARSAEELKGQLGESLPDLVLLDVLMPREDGWDMLNYLKRAPATAQWR